ncbi:hypothetical protein BDY19DRAFT_910925 [Irpex rosettiformis]|uniref:Uncharacterized protein n=1 Tax=Irpex rosettiformis TaxID=378272 RepID=A0ACB8TLZ8_9APHY|nr:hypothetical protein BDY19DRAFT_910925 [Irpex rosettiformis]
MEMLGKAVYSTQMANTFADEPYSVQETVPDGSTKSDLKSPDIVKPFLGQWNGYMHDNNGVAVTAMMSFFIQEAGPYEKSNRITAFGYRGKNYFSMTASVNKRRGIFALHGQVYYTASNDQEFKGELQPDGSITGTVTERSQGRGVRRPSNRFHWMQISAELMLIRPQPPYIIFDLRTGRVVPNKARALFKYACHAVILQNRKSRWAWAYFKERRDNRLRCIAYWTKTATKKSNPIITPRERHDALRFLTQIDLRFWRSVWEYHRDILPEHG